MLVVWEPKTNPKNLNKLVFNTIPILAVWPILVSYRNSVVGIFGWYYDYFFFLADNFGGTPLLNNLAGTPIFHKKGAGMHSKGG